MTKWKDMDKDTLKLNMKAIHNQIEGLGLAVVYSAINLMKGNNEQNKLRL